ncbi:MAG: hypothetical protein DPW14_10230 [Planctomycetes bacterium]|nr:hypothetical protein [Planctomycetota bacterium]
MDSRDDRRWWCDGFLPDSLDAARGCVVGKVWLGLHGTSKQELWDFELFLINPPATLANADWAAQLPAEEFTLRQGSGQAGWVDLDFKRRMSRSAPPTPTRHDLSWQPGQ